MTCSVIDYQPCADPSNLIEALLSRLSHVYVDGPVIRALLTSILKQPEQMESVLCGLISTLDCDVAVGDQLTILGNIVGLPRRICNVYRNSYFGLSNDDDDCCTDELTVGLCEGDFAPNNSTLQYTDYELNDDEEYRFFIKALIQSNNFDGTLAHYTRIVQYLFDGLDLDDPNAVGQSGVITHEGGQVNVAVRRDLTLDELRKAELFKFVMPYYGSTNIKIMFGAEDFFIMDGLNAAPVDTGLCTNFAKVI